MSASESQVIIDRFGAFVGKHSERLRVSVKGEVLEERPFYGLDHVLIASAGVSLSSDLVQECAERGIPISFISRVGRPYAKLMAPGLVGTVKTRREQLLAYLDERGVILARAFAGGKVRNQAVLLKYTAKYRKDTAPETFEKARTAAGVLEDFVRRIQQVRGGNVEEARQELLTLEGHAAKTYWEAAGHLLIPDTNWEGRETRGAQDLVNSTLNYGYGILYCQTERAIVLAGLDPYAGFLHADRAGKPSLVLDLVEEFRQMAVDKAVFGMLNKGVKLGMEDGRLTEESRRSIAEKIDERLDGDEPYEGKRHRLRTIIQMQARHIATFVRGEGEQYKPWVGRW
ncbi:MAG: CRISPR-associated endonuclease Cas1 [Methanotrichaceae archaeon]|nr:CRISPR-associated endonuclease Cas1 [Methanotrichaceae archaeon]